MPLSTCVFEGDNDETTFHLGNFYDDELVSVASFYRESNKDIPEYPIQYRLRGMATLEKYQGRGFGKALLLMSFPIISKAQGRVLWCNARTNAMTFYEKLGFIQVGDEFDIEGVGPHFVMKKTL